MYSKEGIVDCVDCMGPKAKVVEGQPDKQPIKELVASTAKPIARSIAAEGPVVIVKSDKVGRAPAGESTSSKESYQKGFCSEFEMAQDKFDVKALIKEMEASPYADSIKEFWTKPACQAPKKTDITVPILFNTATDVFRSEKFPNVVHDYFVNNKKDPQMWLNAINTQTSDGLTFLDFMQYNIDRINNYSSKESMDAALRIVGYLCQNGGVYSKYKDITKCP